MVVILALLLMPCFVKGPVAQQLLSKYYDGCSKNWWTVLLHINNFNRYEDIVSAVDMQQRSMMAS